MFLLVLLLASPDIACVDSPVNPLTSVADTLANVPPPSIRSDFSTAPTRNVSFPHWSEGRPYAYAPLYQGGETWIGFDTRRFGSCGENGEITAFVEDENGARTAVPLTRQCEGCRWAGAKVKMPEGGSRATIYAVANGDGCEVWDSDHGRNYTFPIAPWKPNVVRFGSDWTETADRPLRGGDTMVIVYDASRLPRCRATYNGYPAWGVSAYVRFDDGTAVNAPVAGSINGPAYVRVPEGATRAEVYFENTDRGGCHDYDSSYGSNYRYEVSPY